MLRRALEKYDLLYFSIILIIILVAFILSEGVYKLGGLAVDDAGNVYSSYTGGRKNLYLRKYEPDGEVAWTKKYHHDDIIVDYKIKNVIVNDAGDIFQIIGLQTGNDFSQIMLKYTKDGELAWRKDFIDTYMIESMYVDEDSLNLLLFGKNQTNLYLEMDFNGKELVSRKFKDIEGWTKFDKPDQLVTISYQKLVKTNLQGEILSSVGVDCYGVLAIDDQHNIYFQGVNVPGLKKFSPSGEQIYSVLLRKELGSELREILWYLDATFDAEQNMYVVGGVDTYTSKNSILVDKNQTLLFDRVIQMSRLRYGQKLSITKIKDNGEIVWNNRISTRTIFPFLAGGVAVDKNGNTYVVSHFKFVGVNTNLLIAKYSSTGERIWIKRKYVVSWQQLLFILSICFIIFGLIIRGKYWEKTVAVGGGVFVFLVIYTFLLA